MDIRCVCGELAPLVVIGEDEPDKELKEEFFGMVVVRCEKCHTITQVRGPLKKAIDDAAKLGGSVDLSALDKKE